MLSKSYNGNYVMCARLFMAKLNSISKCIVTKASISKSIILFTWGLITHVPDLGNCATNKYGRYTIDLIEVDAMTTISSDLLLSSARSF